MPGGIEPQHAATSRVNDKQQRRPPLSVCSSRTPAAPGPAHLPRGGLPEHVRVLRVRHQVRRLAQVGQQQAGVGQKGEGGLGETGSGGVTTRRQRGARGRDRGCGCPSWAEGREVGPTGRAGDSRTCGPPLALSQACLQLRTAIGKEVLARDVLHQGQCWPAVVRTKEVGQRAGGWYESSRSKDVRAQPRL